MIETVNSPIVFSHNDFQPGNLLKLNNDDKIVLIDYEYANYNFRGFDIGNIFCECMMINNYDQHPYFKCDYSLYPNREKQLDFIRSYLDMDIDENEEESYLREANIFALASHFFWSLWSVCHIPSSIFFSNLDYALIRMDIYEKQKKLIEDGVLPPNL